MNRYKPIYEAIRATLVAEAERRKGRSIEAWILAERECVMREVNRQRELLAYAPISIVTVELAERMATTAFRRMTSPARRPSSRIGRTKPCSSSRLAPQPAQLQAPADSKTQGSTNDERPCYATHIK